MLSKLKKLSKDLILYSVLVSEFEKLDFKNDALAGVRANYFNAKCSPQVEKTEVTIDNRPHSLSYSMKKGEPVSWKITFENRPVQTVKRAADGSYCVMSYSENGIVFKRQYFDCNHYWLRTEYYDRALENQMAASVFPSRHDGLVTLRLQRFTATGIVSTDLFPSLKPPKRRCAALIYSNSGMIWYDSAFKPNGSAAVAEPDKTGGFRFSREAFLAADSNDLLGLEEAPYLSADDFEAKREIPAPAAEEEEPAAYSAYDKIAQILFEAQKTNKNIFGELASHAEPGEQAPEETPGEPAAAEEQPAEPVPTEPEQEPEPERMPEPEPEDDDREEQVEIANADEPDATSVITTKNGIYLYYGELDGDGRRSGRGRTVTPDGLTSYDGDYAGDKRNGFGVCYYKEGSPNYIGDWENGSRSGRGVGYRLSDGTLHVGKWNSNKPDGFGARFDSDGNFLDVCSYVDGVRNGKSLSFDEDGNTVVRMWKNGELVSEKIISD